jgi:hypothetical protein
MTKSIKDIQFVIDNHKWILIVSHLFCTNKLVQKHNENVFTETSNLTFDFKLRTLITHHACHLINY